MAEFVLIDAYHPLVASDHEHTCAALCTDYPSPRARGCTLAHGCWCIDGALSYAEFNAKHPDVTVAEA